MNKELAIHVIQSFVNAGGTDICMCPASRNSPLVCLLAAHPHIRSYYFYEERSAAFFALGLSRRQGRPVAIITTSGTAAVELMPAITEAYYTNVPLLAITADRPRNYRGTNAPQTCEQVNLYGQYAKWSVDLADKETCDISQWDRRSPAHINVCFSEPLKCHYLGSEVLAPTPIPAETHSIDGDFGELNHFLQCVKHPLVIVGALESSARSAVKRFLIDLNAPVYAEGLSGLREESELEHLRIHQSIGLWKAAEGSDYQIDGILRIGRVPTVRLWRDLEDLEGKVAVCSLSDVPFSGLSWAGVISGPLESVLGTYQIPKNFDSATYAACRDNDRSYQVRLEAHFKNEPLAEPSIVHELAKKLPTDAMVYLGNSLPIRNWDLAAPYTNKHLEVWATRGLSGIDGQVSTFLGLCLPGKSNWALLGDLTALYDMAGFWIADQLKDISFNVVVINNGGGQIFSRMYSEKEFLNQHNLRFRALADMWGLEYEQWKEIPEILPANGQRLIELIIDNEATKRFWRKLT